MDLVTFGTLEEECGFLSGQEPRLPSWKNSGGIPLDSAYAAACPLPANCSPED